MTGHSTAKFGYDAFGNVRTSQGVGTDATGGDFRFQGQWLESATGMYNFRARDYDSRTGAFLSRDPVDPNEQPPEAFNPYQAMYNNPYIYSDPSGMFTIGELNAAEAVDKILEGIQTSAKRELGQRVKDKAIGVGTDVINSILKSFLPFDAALQGFQLSKGLQEIGGTGFEGIVSGAICRAIGAEAGHSSFLSSLWFEPSLTAVIA